MQKDNLRVQSVEQQRYILQRSSYGYNSSSKMHFIFCDSEDAVEVARYFGQWLPDLAKMTADDTVYNRISDVLGALRHHHIELTEFGSVWGCEE